MKRSDIVFSGGWKPKKFLRTGVMRAHGHCFLSGYPIGHQKSRTVA